MPVKINQRNLNIRISAIGGRVLQGIAESEARTKVFEPAVAEMQRAFEEHPITQEIEAGSDATNISRTLRGNLRDVGNLYSFIGFDGGSNPIEPVRAIFSEGIAGGPSLKLTRVSPRNLVYTFTAKAPDSETIYRATPMPWAEGLSWAKKVETGIPGASRFFRKRGYGRSSGGFQADSDLGILRFVPRTYISSIIGRFIERIAGRRK